MNTHIVQLVPPSGKRIILVFLVQSPLQNSKGNSLTGNIKYSGVGNIGDFQPKLPLNSETIRDRPVVNNDH